MQVFQPCKPMLCASPHWREVVRVMGGTFAIEPKYDGERIHIHKRGKEIKLFTRNSKEYTHRYGYGDAMKPIILQAVIPDSYVWDLLLSCAVLCLEFSVVVFTVRC